MVWLLEDPVHRRRFLLMMTLFAAASAPASASDGFLKRLFGRFNPPQRARNAAKGGGAKKQATGLSLSDADHGLRQALNIGIDAVVQKLGTPGGFLNDPQVRIALPKTLRKARGLAKPLGMSAPFDDLQARMNHGAEAAMPQGKAILKEAVSTMSIDDAMTIVRGPDDSATRYLRTRMEPALTRAFSPVVRASLEQSGAISAGKRLAMRYSVGDYANRAEDNLTRHVVKGALNGAFYYLAEQERAIRANPGAFASELLKRVFG